VIEKGADIAILDDAAEEIPAQGDDLGIEDGARARRQHAADGLSQPHLVRTERPASGHAQRVARPEPPDDERGRVG